MQRRVYIYTHREIETGRDRDKREGDREVESEKDREGERRKPREQDGKKGEAARSKSSNEYKRPIVKVHNESLPLLKLPPQRSRHCNARV